MASEPAMGTPIAAPRARRNHVEASRAPIPAPDLLDLRQAFAEHAGRRLAWIGRFRDLLDAWERDEERETRRLAILMDRTLGSGGAPSGALAGGLSGQVQAFERALIREALAQAGQQRRAAALLGVSPSTLNEKIKRLRVLEEADGP